MRDRFDVVVVGAGAAGFAALRRLSANNLSAVGLEGTNRVGGRAHIVQLAPDLPVDCGAGWMHSADGNLLAKPIGQAGFTLDRSPPHWMRQSFNQNLPRMSSTPSARRSTPWRTGCRPPRRAALIGFL